MLVMGGAVTAMMLPWIPVILRQLPTIAENYSVREATRTLPWSWKLLSEHVQAGLIGAAIGTRTSFAMVPVATRSISKLSDGMVAPWACIIIGTRRTMPSRSWWLAVAPARCWCSSRYARVTS